MISFRIEDNFYSDPWKVREFALTKADYLKQDQLPESFAGTESSKGYYSNSVVQKIEKLINKKIIVNPKNFAFGVFAKTFAKDRRERAIHLDSSEWTALVYLSKPEDCQGGTVVYKNLELNSDGIPSEKELLSRGYENRQAFLEGFVNRHSKVSDHWLPSLRAEMKFNRLVVFKSGSLFHAAESYFGETEDNCRLIQRFFFSTAGDL